MTTQLRQTDADFRRTVERDALAAGWSRDMAAALAAAVGKHCNPPPDERGRRRDGATRARAQAVTRGDRLARIASLYGASALVRDFTQHATPLDDVAAILARVAPSGHITPAGVENVRLQLFAIRRRSTQ